MAPYFFFRVETRVLDGVRDLWRTPFHLVERQTAPRLECPKRDRRSFRPGNDDSRSQWPPDNKCCFGAPRISYQQWKQFSSENCFVSGTRDEAGFPRLVHSRRGKK
ncbi:hypothetical protein JTE90_014988 [Oedothorax gibbosus]|uniref:Uncharacterized protein n=1 Tax=Oedothorax gibbosus TaxID=931172 RepID=A0AAV6UZF3_9ARAC|nr:hypothetical protein JTE90_014988 [Oedothorax gibbosus]